MQITLDFIRPFLGLGIVQGQLDGARLNLWFSSSLQGIAQASSALLSLLHRFLRPFGSK